MNDGLVRREAAPRRVSAAADHGAIVSVQDGELVDAHHPRVTPTGPDRLGAAAGSMARRTSVPLPVHHRHMPMEPLKFHIPRKTKEKRALFQYVSTESREYEDMLSILTSSYIDTSSAGSFTYCQPRLVHSELLEREFVEKRKEMKTDGRTDKELEESYCFLLADAAKLHSLCERGLFVGHSWITVLGNPGKGVYLSRYSDLLQMSPFTPGAIGEIVIFKVMKGKVKSIYENMKNLLDPTPRFDSHISKNTSKVTSLTSYRAFELTQQYFYEYLFDELRQRPRQVCPYAVVSFQVKGKDSSLSSKPLAPTRLNSQSAEGSKERTQYTVWTGDLVKGDKVLFQISLRSFSPPFLPHRLPEKLEIGSSMRLDQVTKLIPSDVFSYNLYNTNPEVVTNGYCCSLLEVIDRSRSMTSITRLLQELEIRRMVLVNQLTERGFLFLLSSVQMATPTERGDSWKRCLQALFIFPETRDVAKSTSRYVSPSHDASESSKSGATVMARLKEFIPGLHHALIKARANPPSELSAGVELQVKEYLMGLNDGKVRQYPMGEYDSELDVQGKAFPTPLHHRVNMDGYLRSYLYSPALYLLSVARARQVMEAHCGCEEAQAVRPSKEPSSNTRERQTNTQKMQQLIDRVLTCKRNAENEVKSEEGRDKGLKTPGRKRKLEQETAERALKFLKASQENGRQDKTPGDGSQASPDSLASVIGSVGLKDIDLREDGSELAARLLSLLTGLCQAASGTAGQSLSEGQEEMESSPLDKLATRLGLPTNCDIDLRKQEELEEQTAGSISSLEGFSPSSHSGEMNHHVAARGGGGGGLGRRAGGFEEEEEEWEIPWVLIPITGLCSERYKHRDRNIPQDPRFQHLATAAASTTTTNPPRKSPTPSPQPSPPLSPYQCPSPEPSPPPLASQCPSPDPSPPPSPSQCPSPEPSPPPSPSQCLSPEPSPPTSPSQCPSPQSSPLITSSQCPSPPSPSSFQSPKPNDLNPLNHDGANKEQLAPTASRDFVALFIDKKEKSQGKEKNEEPSIQPSVPNAPEKRTSPSPPLPPTKRGKEDAHENTGEVKRLQRELLDKEKEGPEMAKDSKQDVEGVVGVIHDVACGKEQKGQAKELASGSVFPSPVSSPAVRDIDSIVDKHLGDFFSEMHHLLQEESVHYSFPQSPHSTSNPESTALPHALPHTSVSQFSQYVSFYNPCPPVQDYVHSLQDGINSMLTEFERWPSHRANTGQTDADAALASKVSAFVAGIRAANDKTDTDDEVPASSDELRAPDVITSVSQTPVVWQPDAVSKPFSDATNGRNPPTSHVTLSTPTSVSGSAYQLANIHNPSIKSPPSQWQPQQSHDLEISRTVTQNVRPTQDTSTVRTVHYATGVEAGSNFAGLNSAVTLPGFSVVSKTLAEPSQSSEPVSSSASVSVPGPGASPAPPATALSSLISQLQPEVFNSLVEIIKDVKRNSLQFYFHSTELGDQVYKDVKEHLLKQGNTEQTPVAFLNQENSDNRLLVIIKNKDIAGHIHEIPGLVSLKRHPSVAFVGIDTLADIRNNSHIELFVSGGCIISDELVLNPDVITHDRLAALLMFLEQHSSPESVWKWKVHLKTHKKLKEQARFRREAANLLDVLSTYQKRQIIEFLPYHHCDMMSHHSPDLDCLVELQARYTQYRHTIFLTEHRFDKLASYSASGIIVASIDEVLHHFTRLVGYHDIKDKQPIMDDLLSPKGLSRQSRGDSGSGPECSPSIFPEHIHPVSSSDQPQQSSSGLPTLPHLSDQLVPDAFCKDAVPQPSETDFEKLRQAISQFRAERQAQLQQKLLDSQTDCCSSPPRSIHANPVCVGSGHITPPLGQGGSNESAQLTPGRKAVAATLDLIHSALQLELGDEGRREDRVGLPTERRRTGGAEPKDQRDDPLVSQNTAAVAGQSNQPDSTSDRREKVAQQAEPELTNAAKQDAASSSTYSCPAGDGRSRNTQSSQEQLIKREDMLPGHTTASTTKLTGSMTVATGQQDSQSPPQPQQQHIQQHLQQLSNQQQQINEHLHLQPRLSHPQHPPQQQWGVGLLQPPHLARFSNQPFSHGPVLGPLTTLGGIRSLLGPTPVWTRGVCPPGGGTLVWGFPQPGTGPGLLGGYHNPAGPSNSRYRGGQRGGGFNGI